MFLLLKENTLGFPSSMHLLEVKSLISPWSRLSFSFLHRRHFVGYGILSWELINLFQLCISNLTVPVVQCVVIKNTYFVFLQVVSLCLGCLSYPLSPLLFLPPPFPLSTVLLRFSVQISHF